MTSAISPRLQRRNPTPVASAEARPAKGVKLTRDPLRIALLVLTVLTVSQVHQNFPILASLRPALVLVVLSAAYAAIKPKSLVRGSIIRTWPAKLVLTLAVLAFLSAPFGLSLGRSAMYIINDYSKVLVFGFLLIAAIRGVRDLATIVWGYVIGCGALAWLSLFVFKLSLSFDSYAYRLNDLYGYDANDVGCVMLIGLALTLLLMQASKGYGRIVAGVILVAIGATLAKTGSRGAFVGMLAVGAYLLVALKTISPVKRIAFVVVVGAALVFAAPPGYWEQMKTLTNPTQDYNWSDPNGRRAVAERGIGYMLQRPVFGVGIANFQLAEGTISDKARLAPAGLGVRWAAAHNSYIEIGSELGVPGLVLWVSLIFGGIWSMMRLRARLPKHWARGDPEERFLHLMTLYMPVALLGFAVTSFFVSFAYLDPIYIVAALMAGLYVSVEAKLKATPQPLMVVASTERRGSNHRGRHSMLSARRRR
jgi:O-antigen ligase